MDKSHLEKSRPMSILLTSNSMTLVDDPTVKKWLDMPPTYETIVQRTNIAQVIILIGKFSAFESFCLGL